jgi:uncharacterized membrane protein YfcA
LRGIPGKKGRSALLLAVLGGLFAGCVNGLLGTGAGTVFFLLAERIYRDDPDVGAKDCFALAMAAVFPVSLASLLTYSPEGTDSGLLFTLIVPGALGGLLGAFLSRRIGQKALKKAFAAVVAFGGAYMVIR